MDKKFKDIDQDDLDSEFEDEEPDVLDFMNSNHDGYYSDVDE